MYPASCVVICLFYFFKIIWLCCPDYGAIALIISLPQCPTLMAPEVWIPYSWLLIIYEVAISFSPWLPYGLFLFILGLINRDRCTFSFIKLSYTFLFLLNPFLVLGSCGVGLIETETMPCGAYVLQETSCSQEWSEQWRVERGVKIREEKARHDGTCL